ncbi:hypothetical protein SDC9_186697 [bioreactor metagenome]|uniref:Uncharacterized protein n=1 Tax=bioreactor metagenome TaxID=1076179 RepID=A0A645HLQ1_9ZZZZ
MIAEQFIVSRYGFSHCIGGSAGLKQMPGSFLSSANFGNCAVIITVDVDLNCLFLGAECLHLPLILCCGRQYMPDVK